MKSDKKVQRKIELTQKENRFVQAYLVTQDQASAIRLAQLGTGEDDPKRAAALGTYYMRKPHVVNAIEIEQARITDKTRESIIQHVDMTVETLTEMLMSIATCGKSDEVKLKATVELLKLKGAYNAENRQDGNMSGGVVQIINNFE